MSFPAEKRADPNINVDLDNLPVERTLGLLWHGESDSFFFTFATIPEAKTKRQVYSAVSKIFDPMGFLACVTLIPKIILQEVWRIGRDTSEPKIRWDDQLPPKALKEWNGFVEKLEVLKNLRVPRSLCRPTSRNYKQSSSCTCFVMLLPLDIVPLSICAWSINSK